MAKKLNAMQKRCEAYQLAVMELSRQVSALATLVNQADQRSTEREERLMRQLNDLQASLNTLS
jgi:uncharacterized protein YukE